MLFRIFARPTGLAVVALVLSTAHAGPECVSNVSQIDTASPAIKRAYEIFFLHGEKGLANKSGGSFIRLKSLGDTNKGDKKESTAQNSSGQIWLQYLSTSMLNSEELEKKQGPIQVCNENGMIRIDGDEISPISLKLDAPEKGCFLVDTFSLLSPEEKRAFCPGDVPALVAKAVKIAKSHALQE